MKNLLKKISAISLVLSVCVTSLAGCTKEKKETKDTISTTDASVAVTNDTENNSKDIEGTVTFWHTYSANSEAKILEDKIIPEFNKEYPNIKIKSVTMPTDNLKQQIIQAAANGSAPDVMRMDIVWVSQFANLGSLVAVDEMEGFDEIKDNSYPATLSTCMWKDKYYGVPLDTNTQVAIYNNKGLETAGLNGIPKSFDELADAAKTIKADHPNGLIGISGMGMWSMAPWFLSLGD